MRIQTLETFTEENHLSVMVFTMHLLTAIDNRGPYFEFSIEDQ